MSRTRVFELHKRFVEGREGVEDDPKSRRPCTSTTYTNIEKVRQLVRSDRRLTIRVIANEVGMDKATVHILVHTLGMRKVCAKMVPRLLTEERKAQRLNACRDILQQMKADKRITENVITGDESLLVFQYDPETKRQSRQWKSVSSPDQRKPACNVHK